MEIENIVYNADDVAIMLKCCKSKAYKLINDLNQRLVKEKKIDKTSIIAGRINKVEFDKIYRSKGGNINANYWFIYRKIW